MADHYIAGSFSFTCTAAEGALLAEAVDASAALAMGDDADPPSAAFLAAFPPTDPGEPWSGYCAAFSDPDFPTLGADFAREAIAEEPAHCDIWFGSADYFDPQAIATLIQRCCPETLAREPVGFEWAATCSRPRVGEFGGGWVAIFADDIVFGSTDDELARALRRAPP